MLYLEGYSCYYNSFKKYSKRVQKQTMLCIKI